MSGDARRAMLDRLATTIDATDQGLDLFRRAAQLASSLNTDLEATVLGDSDLRNFAELPFGNTISISTGLRRSFDRSALDVVSRAARSRIRQVHQELNRRFDISCTTCHEESASRTGTVLRLSMSNRFVLTRGASRPKHAVHSRPNLVRSHNIVSAVSGGEAAIHRTIVQCLSVSQALSCTPNFVADEALRSIVSAELRALGEKAGEVASVEFASPLDIDAFAAAANRLAADLVIAPFEITQGSEAGLQSLLGQIDCPLLLVNAA